MARCIYNLLIVGLLKVKNQGRQKSVMFPPTVSVNKVRGIKEIYEWVRGYKSKVYSKMHPYKFLKLNTRGCQISTQQSKRPNEPYLSNFCAHFQCTKNMTTI